jgi:Spy/CpxP family protein refolding chaperone
MITVAAQAQEQKPGKHSGKHHQREMLSDKLNLSEDQKTQLKAIHEDHRKQMEDLKKNEGITVKERNEKKKAIQEQHKAKMESLLTAEQKEKMEQMRKDAKEGKENRKPFAKRSGHHKQRGEQMKSALGLTDDQSKKLDAANADFAAKAKAIRENQSLTAEQKKEQYKNLSKERQDYTKSILTKEQIEKMESLKSKRQHKTAL